MEIEDYIVSTDQQLITLVLNGDSMAFEYLFNRYRDSIYRLYLKRIGGNEEDTEDLIQETFVKVFLNLHRYNDSFTFGQWLYTIARNSFIDYVRRRRDNTISIDSDHKTLGLASTGSGPTPEESLITDQNRAQLELFMGQLSERYCLLIELRFFKEYSYEEIAAELKLPMGTVKTQIHRAREQLCRLITDSPETLL